MLSGGPRSRTMQKRLRYAVLLNRSHSLVFEFGGHLNCEDSFPLKGFSCGRILHQKFRADFVVVARKRQIPLAQLIELRLAVSVRDWPSLSFSSISARPSTSAASSGNTPKSLAICSIVTNLERVWHGHSNTLPQHPPGQARPDVTYFRSNPVSHVELLLRAGEDRQSDQTEQRAVVAPVEFAEPFPRWGQLQCLHRHVTSGYGTRAQSEPHQTPQPHGYSAFTESASGNRRSTEGCTRNYPGPLRIRPSRGTADHGLAQLLGAPRGPR